jgi:hypothetical protein
MFFNLLSLICVIPVTLRKKGGGGHYSFPKFVTKMSATATVAVLVLASSGDQKPIGSFLFLATLPQKAQDKYSHCRHHWWFCYNTVGVEV